MVLDDIKASFKIDNLLIPTETITDQLSCSQTIRKWNDTCAVMITQQLTLLTPFQTTSYKTSALVFVFTLLNNGQVQASEYCDDSAEK